MKDFTQKDLDELSAHGLSVHEAERQFRLLNKGVDPLQLMRPATNGDGIHVLTEERKQFLHALFVSESPSRDIVKFVPASGAATRMFKDLYEFLETGKSSISINRFFEHLDDFAFSELLRSKINYSLPKEEIIRFLLQSKELGFGEKPKGLFPFHKEEGKVFTPIESHIYEAVDYSSLQDGTVAVHFTLSPESLHEAEEKIWQSVFEVEDKFGVETFIQLSVQDPSTDTIALDENNEIFRDDNGEIVFRPGGHGSLLKNLGETDADIVFIRNIDNILSPKKNTENVYYKKVLGGFLLEIINKQYDILNRLEKKDATALLFAIQFLEEYFFINVDANDQSAEVLFNLLNRPVRVCGMVPNQGEPGGGPFWVKGNNERLSLQIVESSQVAATPDQQAILKSATHFNPVDLVCSLNNYMGNPYRLSEFVDFNSSFISYKSFQGRNLKAIEHPGLWNGSMAGWLTAFVEIPVSTFNPVKTIFDLLR
jgi:hypothetical protein